MLIFLFFVAGARSIYEGNLCEFVLEDFIINEDTVHTFRVAAVSDVGQGPYCMPVNLTKTKACKCEARGALECQSVQEPLLHGCHYCVLSVVKSAEL